MKLIGGPTAWPYHFSYTVSGHRDMKLRMSRDRLKRKEKDLMVNRKTGIRRDPGIIHAGTSRGDIMV